MTWKRGGLAEATIRSSLGRRCRVRYGEKLARFDTRAGECYRLDAELRRK